MSVTCQRDGAGTGTGQAPLRRGGEPSIRRRLKLMGTSMRALSISAAWDETKAILARDGRLLASVALALIALPSAISGLVNPSGMADTTTPAWVTAIAILAALVGLAGQLALIRLALGPSVTVGGAIGHGIRRLPVHFVAVLLLVVLLLIIGVPLG